MRNIVIFIILAGTSMYSQVRSGVLSNGSFEHTMSSGGRILPVGWEWYAWDRSLDDVRLGIVSRGAYDGSNCAGIRSIDRGAAGIVSHRIPIDSSTASLLFTFTLRRSADHYGNRPWVFITLWDNERYINNLDSPLTRASTNWAEASFTIRRDELPARCTAVRLCLAALSLGTAYDGILFYDAARCERTSLSTTEQ